MARRQCKGWQRKGNNCEGSPGFRARLQTRALRTEEELQRLAPERQLFCALLSVTHTTPLLTCFLLPQPIPLPSDTNSSLSLPLRAASSLRDAVASQLCSSLESAGLMHPS